MYVTRSLPLSRVSDSVTATTGSAFVLPTTVAPRIARVYADAPVYVGFGPDDSPPAAATSNSVYQDGGERDYFLDESARQSMTHVYVYALASTADVTVSFLG